MTLKEQLCELHEKSIKNYYNLLDQHYELLQKDVVNRLMSKATLKRQDTIQIGNLYIPDYYREHQWTEEELTPLGYHFYNLFEYKDHLCPNVAELEYLTTKLSDYLKSEGLTVNHTSHCELFISF